MTERPALSKGEMEVVKVIWSLGEATIGQVFDEISKTKTADYSTVQTFVRRLESKGYLKTKRMGRNKVYSAKVRPGTVIRKAVDDFVNQVFDGDLVPMVKHLINNRGISDSELQQIRELIEGLENPDD